MTRQDDTPIQIYVPALRRERIPFRLPEQVFTLDPGLPQTAEAPGVFSPQTYPFSRNQAALVLEELLSIGEAMGMAENPGSHADGHAAWAAHHPGGTLLDDEKADLSRFSAQKTRQTVMPENNPGIVAAQKILLLAWDLESRLTEIATLRRQIVESVRPLAENLHGGEAVDPMLRGIVNALPGALPESLADLPESVAPDWRLTLAAVAAFVPGNAIFVTAHEGIRNALRETGRPHNAERLPGRNGEVPDNAFRTTAPLWRVLGRPREPGNAPWLCAAREFIVLHPKDHRPCPLPH